MNADRSKIWKDIWNKKGDRKDLPIHQIDGFDLLSTDQWDDMVRQVTTAIGIRNGSSVLECGCGAGAFLSSLLKIYPDLQVTGIDYSESLLEVVKSHISGDFYYADMSDISFLQDNAFDNVVSFSTFHYLQSIEAACKAVSEMVRVVKKGGVVFVGEVSDAAKYQQAVLIRQESHKDHRQVSLEKPDHLFLDKEVFKKIAKDLSLTLNIIDQDEFDLAHYETAKYRYSVYLTKTR